MCQGDGINEVEEEQGISVPLYDTRSEEDNPIVSRDNPVNVTLPETSSGGPVLNETVL